ncbi:VRR-NUC domain-containing protein [Alteromonas sp. SM 2104]|nr:VRR-NUC domain-containing protein [Alteromonas oceanisediminis]
MMEFLRCIQTHHSQLLTAEHQQWLEDYFALPHDAQCVVARAANRKHELIAVTSLHYDEIVSPEEHINELTDAGWFRQVNGSDLNSVWPQLTKPELVKTLKLLPQCTVKTTANKAALVDYVSRHVSFNTAARTGTFNAYLMRNFSHTMRYFLFIYFGSLRGQLNQFSMRDMGIMRTRKDSEQQGCRFESGRAAQSAFTYAQWREQLRAAPQQVSLDDLPEAAGTLAERYKDDCLWLLGKAMLTQDPPYALKALSLSKADAAQEKWLRELYKQDNKAFVESELENIIADPPSEELLAFAEDFLARKYHKKTTSRMTDMLRGAARTLSIDQMYINRVEVGVVNFYERHGLIAKRTENALWLSFFGLIFWDILYEQDAKGLVNEFDIRPSVLTENRLYRDHSLAVEERLTQLHSVSSTMTFLLKASAAHYGKVNSLFRWHRSLLDNIKLLVEHSSPTMWQHMLRQMTQDYASLRDGYPDIMVIENGQLRFEEIKAPGDQLRRNQLISLTKLENAGYRVQITTVQWVRDPMQPYAVVDIETTGGRAAAHRITEVGIVKRVNGETVSTWQSLVNPQRQIPKNITALTGISNAMVANAPLFSEVAGAIDEFTKGCIFVAHNVQFDYGFIKQEFARLEQFYRRPKLCTVREMRRTHPGLRSYSLANLTAHFGIQMTRHHRALSDAEAAAELLSLAHDAEHKSE